MMLPNPSVALVNGDGIPTPALLGVLPGLSASDPVVDVHGRATPQFRRVLQDRGARTVPNGQAQLINEDGTPTRVFTALLVMIK